MNFVFENRVFGAFKFLYICGLLLFFSGCTCLYSRTNETLDTFSKIEMEASKYGVVSVGAARVANYDEPVLKKSRKRLRKDLLCMRKQLKEQPLVPESYEISLSQTKKIAELYFGLGVLLGKSDSSEEKPDEFEKISQIIPQLIGKTTPEPNRIDMIALRMAEMKFIEAELEDLKLNEVSPVDAKHRRVVVSLDLAAWVRGEAEAVLVYVDFYPFDADVWCHKAARIVEKQSDKAKDENRDIKGSEYKEEWLKLLKGLRAFDPAPSSEPPDIKKEGLRAFDPTPSSEPPDIKKEGVKDPVAFCHGWLAKNKLLPRLVYVERLGEAEYLVLGGADYLRSRYQIEVAVPLGVSGRAGGTGEYETRKLVERLRASIRPLSLAFAAGDQRAGWLFMPSKTGKEKMPPTERRLRMVVDIPKDLSKLGVHIHKLFLGPDLQILSEVNFAKQVASLNLARWKLNEAEEGYKKYYEDAYEKAKELPPRVARNLSRYYPSPRHWRIVKSRMRNLLCQGWSEELVVDVPPPLKTKEEQKGCKRR